MLSELKTRFLYASMAKVRRKHRTSTPTPTPRPGRVGTAKTVETAETANPIIREALVPAQPASAPRELAAAARCRLPADPQHAHCAWHPLDNSCYARRFPHKMTKLVPRPLGNPERLLQTTVMAAGCRRRRWPLAADQGNGIGRMRTFTKRWLGRHEQDLSIMNRKCLLLVSLACLSLLVWAEAATAQLPNCNCYFNRDCPAETPICELSVIGGGPQGPNNPDRSCEWMEPKPPGGPGTGCDQPYDGFGGPCDGVCVAAPPALVTQQWEHWDGRPFQDYAGSGCLPGGPYSYFIKFVVENEACDLPSHCSLCETEVFIPSGTLAEGTAALVGSTLTTDCNAAGFSFDVTGRRIHAEIPGQVFDVCVNGVKVAAAMSPPGQALVCQDGADPTSNQVAGDFLIVPGLSPEGFAILVSLMLAGSVVALVRRASVRES